MRRDEERADAFRGVTSHEPTEGEERDDPRRGECTVETPSAQVKGVGQRVEVPNGDGGDGGKQRQRLAPRSITLVVGSAWCLLPDAEPAVAEDIEEPAKEFDDLAGESLQCSDGTLEERFDEFGEEAADGGQDCPDGPTRPLEVPPHRPKEAHQLSPPDRSESAEPGPDSGSASRSIAYRCTISARSGRRLSSTSVNESLTRRAGISLGSMSALKSCR